MRGDAGNDYFYGVEDPEELIWAMDATPPNCTVGVVYEDAWDLSRVVAKAHGEESNQGCDKHKSPDEHTGVDPPRSAHARCSMDAAAVRRVGHSTIREPSEINSGAIQSQTTPGMVMMRRMT